MNELPERRHDIAMFFLGGLLGAGVALLFAPASGRRTRRELHHLGKKAVHRAEAIQLELRHAVQNLADDVAEKLQEEFDRGKEWTDQMSQEALRVLNSGKDYIRKEIDRIRPA